MGVCVVNYVHVCVHMGIGVNVRDVVIRVTNLGDELRKEFTIGCHWSVPVSEVRKVTNEENMMGFSNQLRGLFTFVLNGVFVFRELYRILIKVVQITRV